MKIFVEHNETIPAVKIKPDSTSSVTGYIEDTSIEGIVKYGIQGININTPGWYDKKCVRDKIKLSVYAKMGVVFPADVDDQEKWDQLTDAEKSIATHWFVVEKESFFFEVKNDDRYWSIQALDYRVWSEEVKAFRLHIMEAIVFRRMTNVADAKQILADLSQIYLDTVLDIDDVTKKLKKKARVRRMASMYIEGFTSFADDGEAALRDYINSEAGTPFASNGFRNNSFTFRTGHTADSVADELLTVIDGTW